MVPTLAVAVTTRMRPITVSQAPTSAAEAVKIWEYRFASTRVDADHVAAFARQPACKPAFAAAKIEDTLRAGVANRIEDSRVRACDAATDAPLAHRARPRIGIRAPASLQTRGGVDDSAHWSGWNDVRIAFNARSDSGCRHDCRSSRSAPRSSSAG